jgi:hypothetical protein
MRGVVHVWRSASKSGGTKTYTSDALNWCFAKMTRKAGIGDWRAREGRHTAVSIMSSNGVPIQEISGTVSHKFTHVTETVYRHVMVPAIQGGATVLDSVLDDGFGLPTEDDGSRDDALLGLNMISLSQYRHDSTALRAAPTRIVVGVGAQSGQMLAGRGAVAVAERLGTTPVTFPGGHGGFLPSGGPYGGEPDAFAGILRKVLSD